jgi:hypothetical protein
MNADCLDDGFRSHAPTRWRRMNALNGHGQLLIGPDEHSAVEGAMVIAPPGVLLRAPEGSEPLTRDGWRLARWRPDEEGFVLVDQARPVALLVISLAQVIEDLAEWAPHQLVWVASIVERQMRILIGRMSRDCRGNFHPMAGSAFDELVAIRRQGDEAFGRLRSCPGTFPEWMVDEHFHRMERQFVGELLADRERHRTAVRSAGGRAAEEGRQLRLITDLDAAVNPNRRTSDR